MLELSRRVVLILSVLTGTATAPMVRPYIPLCVCNREDNVDSEQGSPECSLHARFLIRGHSRITSKADIWSMGCVISEAASWIAFGRNARREYRELRVKETERIDALNGTGSEACFHDGVEVLPTVKDMHDRICQALLHHDTFTAPILRLVGEYMLARRPQDRMAAREIFGKAGRILGGKQMPKQDTARDAITCTPELPHLANALAEGVDRLDLKPGMPPRSPKSGRDNTWSAWSVTFGGDDSDTDESLASPGASTPLPKGSSSEVNITYVGSDPHLTTDLRVRTMEAAEI